VRLACIFSLTCDLLLSLCALLSYVVSIPPQVLIRMLIGVCSTPPSASAVGDGGGGGGTGGTGGTGGGMALVLLFATESIRTLARDAGDIYSRQQSTYQSTSVHISPQQSLSVYYIGYTYYSTIAEQTSYLHRVLNDHIHPSLTNLCPSDPPSPPPHPPPPPRVSFSFLVRRFPPPAVRRPSSRAVRRTVRGTFPRRPVRVIEG
jgi:hypothetical protein